MAKTVALDLVGLEEIAEMLDVARSTTYQWRTRGLLPDPAAVVSRAPIWHRTDIQEWARLTGRLTD